MDEKGRVSLPAAFRRSAGSESFVLLPEGSSHLTLYPEEVWAEVEEKLLDLRRTGTPEEARWVRTILVDQESVTPDRQGRILIPTRHKDRIGLPSQVVLLGAMDRVEIWPPDDLQASVDEGLQGETPELRQIRQRIMG